MEEYVWISKANSIAIFASRVHPILHYLAREWNVQLTIAGPDDLQDEPFLQAIHDAVSRGAAGLMVHGWGVPGEAAAVDAAVDRGIPVVTVDSDIPHSKRLAHVGTDWFRMGSAMADQLVSLLGESGHILYMGDPHLANVQAGFRGFQYRMSMYPQFDLIGPEDDSDIEHDPLVAGPDQSEAITRTWLARQPELCGVVGFDYQAGIGIASAVKKNAMTGKVKVVCVDAEAPHVGFVREGVIQAAFSQRRELFTYQAFETLHNYNHGSATTGFQPGPANVSGNIDTGFIIVTKGNVDSFHDELDLASVFERQALTRRLALMSTIVESSGQMILAIDAQGGILYANPASGDLTGLSNAQIMRSRAEDIFEFGAEHSVLLKLCESTHVPATFLAPVRRADGATFPAQVTASALHTDAARPGLVLIAADITVRQKALEALAISEARWQFALEGAGDGVWDWNILAAEVYYSPQWKAMLGYEDHEIGNGLEEWEKRLHPDDKAATYALLNDLLAGRTPTYASEHRMLCKDGSYTWILDRGKVVEWSSDGKPLRAIGTHTLIAERKQLEEALRSNERYARQFQERLKALHSVNLELAATPTVEALCEKAIHLGHSVLGFDRLGVLLFDDAQHVSRFGIESNGEFLAETHTTFTESEHVMAPALLTDRDSVLAFENAPLRDFDNKLVGHGWNVITGLWDGDTNIGWMAADNFFDRQPLIPYQVELLRLYGLTVSNLVVRKRAEHEIIRLNEELEQRVIQRTQQLQAVNSELEAFAYSVSHDLRTPLRAIDGFSQALLEDCADQLDDQGRSYLDRVRASSQRMGKLIDDLLKLSRVTRQDMHHETVDLSALARAVADELREIDPARQVEFDIADDVLAHGDSRLLRLVLENLFGNAWKFTALQPHAVITFSASTRDDSGEPVYTVSDNGVGFDMAYADKLFGVFQRLHAQTEFAGTGIGLATVRRIVLRHGGRVWAESEVGKGATIRFTLGSDA